jgi:hypothetical protein
MTAFKILRPDTSPGLSGRTHHLLTTTLRVPAFLKAVHTLTGFFIVGTAPWTGDAVTRPSFDTSSDVTFCCRTSLGSEARG